MQSRGFSLMEIVLVIAVISILLAIGTLSFKEYFKRYRTESQTRLLYAELLKARANAICQRRWVRVKLYTGRFEVYSSQADDGSGAGPVSSYRLEYPITASGSGSPEAGFVVDFKPQGTIEEEDERSICLEPNEGSGVVDSIKISVTRISIGKKDVGDVCKSDNIKLQ